MFPITQHGTHLMSYVFSISNPSVLFNAINGGLTFNPE